MAMDAVRVNSSQVSEWLSTAATRRSPVARGTLKNYLDGRREMPVKMRKLLARQLRRHADRLRAVAQELENSSR